jgi:hypothetical protein
MDCTFWQLMSKSIIEATRPNSEFGWAAVFAASVIRSPLRSPSGPKFGEFDDLVSQRVMVGGTVRHT